MLKLAGISNCPYAKTPNTCTLTLTKKRISLASFFNWQTNPTSLQNQFVIKHIYLPKPNPAPKVERNTNVPDYESTALTWYGKPNKNVLKSIHISFWDKSPEHLFVTVFNLPTRDATRLEQNDEQFDLDAASIPIWNAWLANTIPPEATR